MKIKFSSWPSFSVSEIKSVKKVLQSNKVNYWTGNECRKFEKEFAKFFNSEYAVSLSNGTVAIDLALKAIDIQKGDEIIVTSRTFIASASCIVNAGGIPVFADVCPNSQNFRSSNILKLITKKTKAIVCVHLAGWPCEMDNIMKIAKKNKLFVIEDCAQAHGAKYKGKSVGSIGHIGCWSFCQDKIMTTGGEGGMVTTNSKNLWKKMWAYKDHGKSYDKVYNKKHQDGFRWLHDSFGSNGRMTEIQAAIGRAQLKKMNEWTKKRNHNQSVIWNNCSKLDLLRVPKFNEKSWKFFHKGNVHAAYKCYVFVNKDKLKKGWSRDKIVQEITKLGVPCFSGSCSEVYLEKAFVKSKLRPKKRLKTAKNLGESSLCFLIHPTVTKKEINLTCQAINLVAKAATA
ncbi:MAG: aminotransferase [Rhodobacteraceae bacterium TMED111]|nr:MAG: aminotransferase [Rhodobacteraceae bacterium TMED111]|tara:strand:+ start:1015 stop:2211 length:1197 start_codon:yes stop_codon:yes gene_type:complete